MLGVPSAAFKIHPTKLTALVQGLYSSIHSSSVDAAVPIQATSLIRILRKPAGVFVGAFVSALAVLVEFTEEAVAVKLAADAVAVRLAAEAVAVRFAADAVAV